MKKKIIKLIRILGIGIDELVLNLDLDSASFDSIEWDREENKIYLHIFGEDDLDISFDFDELSEKDHQDIYNILSIIYN
jgi:hypothetical protein